MLNYRSLTSSNLPKIFDGLTALNKPVGAIDHTVREGKNNTAVFKLISLDFKFGSPGRSKDNSKS